MKRLGIIGGMSWESTALYYSWINQGVKEALGGLHSADLVLHSVDFQPIETMQAQGNWQAAGEALGRSGAALKAAGAQGLVIATNTMHKVANVVEDMSGLPLLHIADCTGEAIAKQGMTDVALLGTAFTMEQTFYKDRLVDKFNLNVMVPNDTERADVHRIIYEELCLGQVHEESKQRYVEVVENLQSRGAEAVIMGCTEITMLLSPEVTTVPLIDTTRIHAGKAVAWMLSDD